MANDGKYIHGFSQKEQNRLWHQANIQRENIYSKIDFSGCKKILEVGCGVGAQTRILCEENPNLKIVSIDTSKKQIATARINLKEQIESGQVELLHIKPEALPFKENNFDGAFICWVLEHVSNPSNLLSQTYKVLKNCSPIYCNEVLNNTLHVHPRSPCLTKYWFEFNDHQWNMGGDPFIGARLGNLLQQSQYKNIETKVLTLHLDNRAPEKKNQFIDYWCNLLVSGAPSLIQAKKVSIDLVEKMKKEMHSLKNVEDSVLFYSWILAFARK